MASAKRETEAGNGNGAKDESKPAMVGKYNLKDLLPEGYTEKDVILTGQLLPQFLGKEILDRGKAKGVKIEDLPILCGLIDRIEVLPIQERKNQKDFSPFSVIVRELKVPSVGYRGAKDKREEVVLEANASGLFPISGQQTVNKDLLKALRDTEYLYWFSAEVIGEKQTDPSLNPMVDYRVRVMKTNVKRTDRGAAWALDAWYMACLTSGDLLSSIACGEHVGLVQTVFTDGLDVTPVGNLINRKTGDILGRLGPMGNVLPPERAPAEVSAAASPS